MRTITQLFENSCNQFADNTLIWEKNGPNYKGITYREIHNQVLYLAAGMIRAGVNKGDKITLLADGSSQWLVAELASLYVGAIVVPVSIKLTEPAEIIFRLTHSECRYIFVSSNQKEKITSLSSSLPMVKKIIVIGGEINAGKGHFHYLTLLKDGKENFEIAKIEITKRLAEIGENDLATISYTSGTTSDPKGIMLTHRNYTANVEQANSLFDVPQWYCTLLILPWDHAFAHTVGLFVMIKNGASIAVVEQGKSAMENLRNIPKNIREIKPVFLLSVPSLARSFKKSIESAIKARGGSKERLFKRALKLAYRYYGDTFSNTMSKNNFLKFRMWIVEKLVFSKIRKQFGGRLEFFIGGGALLDIELQQFFYAIGIPMFQGYGLSEAAPVISSNTPSSHKLGSSGRIVNNLELKIVDENGNKLPFGAHGEIVVKGENVMKGYWKNEKATAETLHDGWLFTGDIGYLDSDGFLYVLGRHKSLLIGSDGEKFSPEGIEESLIDTSPFVDQCMLYNNQGPYTIALIVPNKKALREELLRTSLDQFSETGILESLFLIRGEIDQFYDGGKHQGLFPQRWLPSAFAILDEPFTEENRMINSTLKLVRSKVVEKHQSTIDYLYTPEGKKMDNEKNIAAMKRLFSVSPESIEK